MLRHRNLGTCAEPIITNLGTWNLPLHLAAAAPPRNRNRNLPAQRSRNLEPGTPEGVDQLIEALVRRHCTTLNATKVGGATDVGSDDATSSGWARWGWPPYDQPGRRRRLSLEHLNVKSES